MIQSAKLHSPINYANVAVMFMQNDGEENELDSKKSLNLFFDYLKKAKIIQKKEVEAIEAALLSIFTLGKLDYLRIDYIQLLLKYKFLIGSHFKKRISSEKVLDKIRTYNNILKRLSII